MLRKLCLVFDAAIMPTMAVLNIRDDRNELFTDAKLVPQIVSVTPQSFEELKVAALKAEVVVLLFEDIEGLARHLKSVKNMVRSTNFNG